jgi:LysM repeat protein
MMRFMHSRPRSKPLALAARRAATCLLAAVAGGCSAEISRFDFPGFSLTDDKKDTTASLQSPSGGPRGPSYLGNDGKPAATPTYDRGGYVAPQAYRDNGDNGVRMANLPETSAPPSAYAQEQRQAPQPPARQAPALRPGELVQVQQGDTLYNLSRRHHVSVAELMEVNGLNNPSLHPGQTIYLPEGYAAQRPQQRVAAAAPAPLKGKYGSSYTVRNGDSIYAISKSHGVTVAELQQANGITDVRTVRAGTVLKVPGAATVAGPG